MKIEELQLNKNKENQLRTKNIDTIDDLLQYLPKEYIDYTTLTAINALDKSRCGEYFSVKGQFRKISQGQGKTPYIKANFYDENEDCITIFWFGNAYMASRITTYNEYVICGKLTCNDFGSTITNPEVFYTGGKNLWKRIKPVYSKIKGMSDNFLAECIKKAISLKAADEDILTKNEMQKFDVISSVEAYYNLHFPKTMEDIEIAKKRIIFQDLYYFAGEMIKREAGVVTIAKNKCTKENLFKKFISSLPFELTIGQSDAISFFRKQMADGKRIQALLQGDVGCGKTVVAFAAMINAAENGFQSAIMCPTAILAQQHFNEAKERFKNFDVNIVYLASDVKAKAKKESLKKIASGEVNIVIGTHSVISKDVQYNNLGLIVIDEEHRFGVMQREALTEKGNEGIHSISMSATPIPRSLATTMYGEYIEVITIDSLPKGRLPVKTIICEKEISVYKSINKQIQEGRQAYVICPLIEDSDKLENVESVDITLTKMQTFWKGTNIKIECISGKTKKEEIAAIMEDFKNNKINILISTTIIEVGVNVPNATVIFIKNAERFGLAQLHQLRGRVGRSNYQSYCVLMSTYNKEGLNFMAQTNSGFDIAKKDLELRGTGDIIGIRQSGEDRYITLMLAYSNLYSDIKKYLREK